MGTFKGRIPLNQQKSREVRELYRAGFSVKDIAKKLGVTGQDVQGVLCSNKETVCLGNRKPRKPDPVVHPKPVWVKEVEKHTGCQAIYSKGLGKGSEEWILLSPNKVALLIIWGRGDLIQGTKPCKRFSIQGINQAERLARVRATKVPTVNYPEIILPEINPQSDEDDTDENPF